jgi:hypothetical protein
LNEIKGIFILFTLQSKIKNMPHGIAVYEVLENGNLLNGIYANTDGLPKIHYDIDNEIARKDPKDPLSLYNTGVQGLYKCRYIETVPTHGVAPLSVTPCSLTITPCNEVYEFVWSDTGGPFFKGIGFKVGNNHIAVSYTNA